MGLPEQRVSTAREVSCDGTRLQEVSGPLSPAVLVFARGPAVDDSPAAASALPTPKLDLRGCSSRSLLSPLPLDDALRRYRRVVLAGGPRPMADRCYPPPFQLVAPFEFLLPTRHDGFRPRSQLHHQPLPRSIEETAHPGSQ